MNDRDRNRQKFFEEFYSFDDISKYTELECLLLEIPEGYYKDPVVQQKWVEYCNAKIKINIDGLTVTDHLGVVRMKIGNLT